MLKYRLTERERESELHRITITISNVCEKWFVCLLITWFANLKEMKRFGNGNKTVAKCLGFPFLPSHFLKKINSIVNVFVCVYLSLAFCFMPLAESFVFFSAVAEAALQLQFVILCNKIVWALRYCNGWYVVVVKRKKKKPLHDTMARILLRHTSNSDESLWINWSLLLSPIYFFSLSLHKCH